MIKLWFGDGSVAPAATTLLVILLTSKAAIFHCTDKDQSIHIHLGYNCDQSELILHWHKIEFWSNYASVMLVLIQQQQQGC
jgi:hypothetical protein